MPLCLCLGVCQEGALQYGFVGGGQARAVNKVVKTRTQTHSCTSICCEEIKTAEQAQVQHVTLEIKATKAKLKLPARPKLRRKTPCMCVWSIDMCM